MVAASLLPTGPRNCSRAKTERVVARGVATYDREVDPYGAGCPGNERSFYHARC